MKTVITFTHDDQSLAVFEGSNGHGTFACSDIIPLSIAWHLAGSRFGDVVAIAGTAASWLETARIVSADSGPEGTRFELCY